MRRAIALARKSMNEGQGGPFGAVIVQQGEIIGEGWNQVVSSKDPTAHGEISAMPARAAIFPARLRHLHTVNPARCASERFIGLASIASTMVFGFPMPPPLALMTPPSLKNLRKNPEQRKIASTELLRDEALVLAEEYQQLPQRIAY